MQYKVKEFFDKATWTLTYVVYDSATRDAVIVDPVMDFEPASGECGSESVSVVADFIRGQNLNPRLVLETHVHADHLSGAVHLKNIFPGLKVGISANIVQTQKIFQGVFNVQNLAVDGSQFDELLYDRKEYRAGSVAITPYFTPGHTPACTSYMIGEALFVGDTIFMPDSGTGRCDFPGGSAKTLFQSIREVLYAFPDSTKIYVGHDYQPGGRELRFQTTVAEEKAANIHLRADTTEAEFVAFREGRDKTLTAPRLLYPSVQVNMDGGRLPRPESNGISYLKIPLKIRPPNK